MLAEVRQKVKEGQLHHQLGGPGGSQEGDAEHDGRDDGHHRRSRIQADEGSDGHCISERDI